MNDYLVTVDLRRCNMSKESIKRSIKMGADLLATNEITNVHGYKMLWKFSSTDKDVENKVQKVLNNMFETGSICGGKIEKK